MAKRIECELIRKHLIDECKRVKEFSTGIDPRLGILLCEPQKDDLVYCHSIENLIHKLDVTVQKTVVDKRCGSSVVDAFMKRMIHTLTPVIVIGKDPNLVFPGMDFTIPPELDIDCFDQKNRGLWLNGDPIENVPITAMSVLQATNLIFDMDDYSPVNALVIGRGKIGLDVATALRRLNATVSIAHSKTPPRVFENLVYGANMIVSCVGKPNYFDLSELCKGENDKTIIDVGFTMVDGNPYGDIEYDVELIPDGRGQMVNYTTVRNGIGSITTAYLMHEVFDFAVQKHAKR